MTLSEFQGHLFLKCCKNGEIQLMTPTPCRVAECIISIRRTYSCAVVLTYLLTYTVGSASIKPVISPKRLKRAKLTINGLYKVVAYMGFRFSIAVKMYDLEWHLSEGWWNLRQWTKRLGQKWGCGQCRSGHIGTIWQGWTMQEEKTGKY